MVETVKGVSIAIPTLKEPREVAEQLDQINRTSFCFGPSSAYATNWKGSAAINRNMCLDRTCTEYIIMLDDDIWGFYPMWDCDLLRPLIEDENIIMVSARLMQRNGAPAYMLCDGWGERIDDGDYIEMPGKELPTSCFAIRRNEVRFNEGYIGSGFEDNQYCIDLAKAFPCGKFIVNNKCKVIHANEKKNQHGEYWEHNRKLFNELNGTNR